MKKILAVFLAITMPIWYIPVAITFILGAGFYESYKSILKLIEGHWIK
jgi:hypothetical protein